MTTAAQRTRRAVLATTLSALALVALAGASTLNATQPSDRAPTVQPGDIFLVETAPEMPDSERPGPGITGRVVKNAKEVRALVQWVGIETHARDKTFLNVVEKERAASGWLVRCRTQEEFDRVWKEHKGEAIEKTGRWEMIPRIDFGACEVVAFFRAEATNTDGEAIERIVVGQDEVTLRFDSESYQTMTMPGEEPDTHTGRSYGIWVIPRTDLPIRVEDNRSGMHYRPMRYVTIATLEVEGSGPVHPW